MTDEATLRRRRFVARIIAAFYRAGWRPPPPSDRAVERLTADVERVTRERGGWMKGRNPTLDLSPAQIRAIGLLAEGQTTKEIARALGVGSETVKYHLHTAYEKLGARNAASAVAIAFRSGLLR